MAEEGCLAGHPCARGPLKFVQIQWDQGDAVSQRAVILELFSLALVFAALIFATAGAFGLVVMAPLALGASCCGFNGALNRRVGLLALFSGVVGVLLVTTVVLTALMFTEDGAQFVASNAFAGYFEAAPRLIPVASNVVTVAFYVYLLVLAVAQIREHRSARR